MQNGGNQLYIGAGISSSISKSSLRAVISAVNQMPLPILNRPGLLQYCFMHISRQISFLAGLPAVSVFFHISSFNLQYRAIISMRNLIESSHTWKSIIYFSLRERDDADDFTIS
jgi:hypothetical protein